MGSPGLLPQDAQPRTLCERTECLHKLLQLGEPLSSHSLKLNNSRKRSKGSTAPQRLRMMAFYKEPPVPQATLTPTLQDPPATQLSGQASTILSDREPPVITPVTDRQHPGEQQLHEQQHNSPQLQQAADTLQHDADFLQQHPSASSS
ncbi:hypothetical protein Efla_002506 [Eimeria flavescens]